MPVTLDAVFNFSSNSFISNANDTSIVGGMTVGSGANALLLGAVFPKTGSADFSTIMNATWDYGGANQAMTLLGSIYDPSSDGNVFFLGLLNPVAGAKTLRISGTLNYFYTISALSFNGVNSLLLASAFTHFTYATGNGLSPLITVASATGNMAASLFLADSVAAFSSVSPTSWFNTVPLGDAAGSYTAGAVSVPLGATLPGGKSGHWIAAGIDVAAQPATVVTAVNFVGSAKTIGVPAFSTKQVFNAVNYADSVPVFGVPAFSVIVPMPAVVNYADSAPTLGAPALSAISVFAAVNFVGSAKAIDAPTLNVISGFAAANYADSAPTLGVPAMVITGRTLFANNLAVSSPFFSGIAIGSLTAPGLTSAPFKTGSPQLAQPVLVIPPKIFTAVNFITTSPQLGSSFCFPIIHMFAAAVSGGHPVLDAPGADELGPPMVWLRQRLKNWSNDPNAEFYDEDGTENEGPVQQSIFTNMNDDIELSVSSGTLVGRSAPDWGPAEIIQPVYPLVLQNNKLQFDLSNLNYLNDAAAAAGGVPIGGLYRNGNVLMVRVT